MRLLVDECVPRPLLRDLIGPDAHHVVDLGWSAKRNGELLWEKDVPGPAGAPMTYLAGGRQYVVIAVGGGLNSELIAFALRSQ